MKGYIQKIRNKIIEVMDEIGAEVSHDALVEALEQLAQLENLWDTAYERMKVAIADLEDVEVMTE